MTKTNPMIHVNYHMAAAQIENLKNISEKTGLSVAELIRRAVDEWLDREVRIKMEGRSKS